MAFPQHTFFAATLLILSAVAAPASLACGGGGSGAYRKPARPDQAHHQTIVSPQARGSEPLSEAATPGLPAQPAAAPAP